MAGGRMHFDEGEEVRFLTLDGRVSEGIYVIVIGRADRRGLITIAEKGTTRQIKVTQRRILQNCAADGSFVVASGDKFRAVCPRCSYTSEVSPSDDSFECPSHGVVDLQWRKGERPMIEATTTTKTSKPKAEKPTPTKKPRPPARERIVVDLKQLAETKDCELWTKRNVRFDHEMVDVQAHTLLYVGDEPRKLCWNTYDGCLGKKSTQLPVDDFTANTGEKKRWYAVKSLDNERARLTKEGYEKS